MNFVARKLIGGWIAGAIWFGVAWATKLPSEAVNVRLSCPADVETLTTEMLRDLPSYANRVIQQSRRLKRKVDIYSYVVIAGRPEFTPLTLGPGEYIPTSSAAIVQEPAQVFITTLERQYTAGKVVELQQYHWLFLTQTSSGWDLAMMFSRTGIYPDGQPPTPPRDSSYGSIAQGIRTWLRDCRSRSPSVPPKAKKRAGGGRGVSTSGE